MRVVLGVGVDVCEMGRVLRLAERFGDRFLTRAFHESEISAIRAAKRPDRRKELLAGKWAVKEALQKAIVEPRLLFPEVEVWSGPGGVGVRVFGEAKAKLQQRGVEGAHVSLSHDAGICTAVVIVEGSAGSGGNALEFAEE